jgi:plasmid maintenance system antidote protein VapI
MAKSLILNGLLLKMRYSVLEFENAIDVPQGRIYKSITRNTEISADTVQKIITKFPEVRKEWLETGEGAMFDTSDNTINANNKNDNRNDNNATYISDIAPELKPHDMNHIINDLLKKLDKRDEQIDELIGIMKHDRGMKEKEVKTGQAKRA